MRGWLYVGLGFLLGLIVSAFVTIVFYWYIWHNDIVLWIQLPIIIAVTVWGSKGFPIRHFRLPGATGND